MGKVIPDFRIGIRLVKGIPVFGRKGQALIHRPLEAEGQVDPVKVGPHRDSPVCEVVKVPGVSEKKGSGRSQVGPGKIIDGKKPGVGVRRKTGNGGRGVGGSGRGNICDWYHLING